MCNEKWVCLWLLHFCKCVLLRARKLRLLTLDQPSLLYRSTSYLRLLKRAAQQAPRHAHAQQPGYSSGIGTSDLLFLRRLNMVRLRGRAPCFFFFFVAGASPGCWHSLPACVSGESISSIRCTDRRCCRLRPQAFERYNFVEDSGAQSKNRCIARQQGFENSCTSVWARSF